MERARQWAVRCMHEAQLHDQNCFITLTYNDENLPDRNSLDYKEFQLFMRRFRKKAKKKIRFYMAGEYGEQKERPHYHACIFGYDFPDKKIFKKSAKGITVYTSETLDKLWPKGYATTCDMTFSSAQYCASYIMKKQNGARSEKDYQSFDRETGEVLHKEKEFAHMSLKPGIGSRWYEKYKSEVFPHDRVIVNGFEMKPPRYYTRLLKEQDKELHDQIIEQREVFGKKSAFDNEDERLMVKEQVLKAKIAFKARRSI